MGVSYVSSSGVYDEATYKMRNLLPVVFNVLVVCNNSTIASLCVLDFSLGPHKFSIF